MIYKSMASNGSGTMAHAKNSAEYMEDEEHDPLPLTGTVVSRLAHYVQRQSAHPQALGDATLNPDEVIAEYEARSQIRSDIQKPVVHCVLSYHPDDLAVITPSIRADISQRFVRELIAADNDRRDAVDKGGVRPDPDGILHYWVSHNDRPHPHDHGLIHRVSANGGVWLKSLEQFEARKILRQIEADYGLHRMDAAEYDPNQAQAEQTPARTQRQDPLAIAAYGAWLDHPSWDGFVAALAEQDVSLRTNERRGGMAFVDADGRALPASKAGFRGDMLLTEVKSRWDALAHGSDPSVIRREFFALRHRAQSLADFQRGMTARGLALIERDRLEFQGIPITADAMGVKPTMLVPPRKPQQVVAIPTTYAQPKPLDRIAAFAAALKSQRDAQAEEDRRLADRGWRQVSRLIHTDGITPTADALNARLDGYRVGLDDRAGTLSIIVPLAEPRLLPLPDDGRQLAAWLRAGDRTERIAAYRARLSKLTHGMMVPGWETLRAVLGTKEVAPMGMGPADDRVPWAAIGAAWDPLRAGQTWRIERATKVPDVDWRQVLMGVETQVWLRGVAVDPPQRGKTPTKAKRPAAWRDGQDQGRGDQGRQ